jgi:hypothetical protein
MHRRFAMASCGELQAIPASWVPWCPMVGICVDGVPWRGRRGREDHWIRVAVMARARRICCNGNQQMFACHDRLAAHLPQSCILFRPESIAFATPATQPKWKARRGPRGPNFVERLCASNRPKPCDFARVAKTAQVGVFRSAEDGNHGASLLETNRSRTTADGATKKRRSYSVRSRRPYREPPVAVDGDRNRSRTRSPLSYRMGRSVVHCLANRVGEPAQ